MAAGAALAAPFAAAWRFQVKRNAGPKWSQYEVPGVKLKQDKILALAAVFPAAFGGMTSAVKLCRKIESQGY